MSADGAPESDNEAVMLSKLLPYISSHQPIPLNLMVEAFNTAGHIHGDSESRRVAEALLPEAGVYLHSIELSWFISARGTDDEARDSISHRKGYVARAASLLPVLLSFLDVKVTGDLGSILRRIDDFCRDFPVIEAMPHEKKVRKEISAGIRRIALAIADLNMRLDEFEHHIENEFNHHKAAIGRESGSSRFANSFKPFRGDLRRLALAAEIVLYREDVGEHGLIVSDNKTRTQTVQCMYQLSLWQNAPPFVTTPGADFATACGLLYEIASGERDVSLAGAINKFARSAARAELYEEEQSFRWDNSDEGMRAREADNFASVREQTSKLQSETAFWKSMLQSNDWDAFSKRELLDRSADVSERLERTLLENGPHLVWGDQVRRAYDFLDLQDRLLNAEIALGMAIRRPSDN